MGEVTIEQLKKLLIEDCLLNVKPGDIGEDSPLFGPGSIGLDSLDALQIVVAIEKNFGITISDSQTAREVMQSLATLQEWIARQQHARSNP